MPVQFIQDARVHPYQAASAAFLSFLPDYFKDKVYLLNRIRNAIATKFSLEIHSICICGSAHLGYSYFKNTPFEPGRSDLDVAIISSALFARYYDYALDATDGFANLTKFASSEEKDRFLALLTRKGMLRPDLAPRGPEKTTWEMFFNQLSGGYRQYFRDINAAIYISEKAYVTKQIACVRAARGEGA